jgi:hypothetical protein
LTKGKSLSEKARRATTRDAAEGMAIRALAFLAARPEDLGRFLDLDGLDSANLRAAAADPGFLAGVLFLLQDESLLLAFAAEAGMDPVRVAAAGRVLDEIDREGNAVED